MDFLLWIWPEAKMTIYDPKKKRIHTHIHTCTLARLCRWAIFFWFTCRIARVDDVHSYRFTDSFSRFQCSVQPLHPQLPAVLFAEVVGNSNASQSSDDLNSGAIARHRGQHTDLRWTLAVHQEVEDVLRRKRTNSVNLKTTSGIYCILSTCEYIYREGPLWTRADIYILRERRNPTISFCYELWDSVDYLWYTCRRSVRAWRGNNNSWWQEQLRWFFSPIHTPSKMYVIMFHL